MAAQPRLLLAVALAIAPLSAALVAPATPFLGLRALSVHAGTVAPRARPGRAVVALRMSAASSGVRPLPPPRLRGEFVCSSPGLLSYRTITSAPPSAPRALSVARALPRPPHRPARLKRVPAIFALAWQTASDADLQDKQLKDKIANFYDQSSPLWEDIWGMLCTRARSLVSRAFRVVCASAARRWWLPARVYARVSPACMPACLHACMPACLHACFPASLPPCLPAFLPPSSHRTPACATGKCHPCIESAPPPILNTGEHMHMGHYGAEGDEEKSDAQAQIDMVDRLLAWGKSDPSHTQQRPRCA